MSVNVSEFRSALGATWGAHDPDESLRQRLREGVVGEARMLIDGKLVESESGRDFDNVNPATELSMGVTTDGDARDVDRAVAAARRAFDESSWSTDHDFRRRCLLQLQAGLARAADELRATAVAEIGIAARTSYGFHSDFPTAALSYWAETATSYAYEHALPDQPWAVGTHRIVRHEAVGVVAAITPWNFPLWVTISKLGPALAAGCTVILKPAAQTPWYATLLARVVAEETDIPAGVLNVLTTSDNAVAELLTTDPRVDLIHFTGSTAVGKRLMTNAARHVTKVALELGGKSANIILEDMPLETVVPLAAGIVCINSGQGCVLPTRLLVPESNYDQAVELATTAYENVSYGDPCDPTTFQGPQVTKRQQQRVLDYIGKGVEGGARLAAGGGVPPHLTTGYYVEPTLFVDVDPGSVIAQEEIFGPVLSLIPYRGVDEAVRIANQSVYGLAGSVWSTDRDAALAVARSIRSGMISVNGGNFFSPDLPGGGYKQSGLGRENGIQGFEEFLETKAIAVGY